MISQIIKALAGCKTIEAAMVIDSTDTNGILLDSIAVDEIPSNYKPKTIFEIQHTSSLTGDSPYKDSLVQTTGIVTARYNNGFWIQDSTVGWHGLYIFDSTAVNLGDFVIVEGKVAEFFNLTEIKNVEYISTIPSGKPLPVPLNLTTTTVNDEQYEGMLVKVTNSNCVNASAGNGEWLVQDIGEDTTVIDDLMFAYTPNLGNVYSIRGILHYSFNKYKIEPRDTFDIFNTTSINEIENLSFSLFPNPVTSRLNIVSDETIKAYAIYSVTGKLVESLTSNSIKNISVLNLEKGIYILKLTSESSVGIKKFVKN